MLHAYGYVFLRHTCRLNTSRPVSCRTLRQKPQLCPVRRKKLLAVTLYKKGAETVQHVLEARDTVIAEQAARIEQLMAAATPPGTEHSAPAPTRFRDQVWPEVHGQLGFFSKEQKKRFTAEQRGSSRGRS